MLDDMQFADLMQILETVEELVAAVDALPSHDINELPTI